MAAICYASFNTITSEYIMSDIWSSKFINSMTFGCFTILARTLYELNKTCCKKRSNHSSALLSSAENEQENDDEDERFHQQVEDIARRNKTKAVLISLFCGVLNFFAQLILLISFDLAARTNTNLGLASTMLSGCILWGLFGSYCFYDEVITPLQLGGSLMLLSGNATLALFSEASAGEETESGIEVTTSDSNSTVVIFAIISMCLLGLRVVISKTATQVLGPIFYLELNFYVEFALGLLLLIPNSLGSLAMTFEL